MNGDRGEGLHIDAEGKSVDDAVRKALESLQSHWSGLTVFVDDPKIPMDNNASE